MRTILRSISTLILCSSFLVTTARAAPDEWYTYRYDSFRTGAQPYASSLSDPSKVGTLAVKWSFPTTPNGVGAFHASPIVVNDTVFVGNTNGYFYALDAATGALHDPLY
jgi:outer membrane protein assembly factor BamB